MIVASVAGLLCSAILLTGPKGPVDFVQIAESKNVSQLVRSNSNHFWTHARDPRNLGDFAVFTREKGVIAGDPHLGNFSVIPTADAQGRRSMRFLNIDFDDAGRGSFALDFARLLIASKAVTSGIKTGRMVEAYVAGLRGEESPLPRPVEKALSLPIEKYDRQREKYVEKRVERGRFRHEPGEIEPWTGSPGLNEVRASLKGLEVLDLALRPKERGGSADGLRLWVLVRDRDGHDRILELKQYQETGLIKAHPQLPAEARVRELHEHLWPGMDGASYRLIEVEGRRFWLREKKVTVLEYASEKEGIEGMLLIANRLGLLHGRQAEGPDFLRRILRDPEAFADALKDFAKSYLKLADRAMR